MRAPRGLRVDPSLTAAIASSPAYAVSTWAVVPLLRQDWTTNPAASVWHGLLAASLGGWLGAGIGSPSPYPTTYVVDIPLALCGALTGLSVTTTALLLASGALCAFGARALAKDWGCGAAATVASVVFFSTLPWVYAELVAGHGFMPLAYGGSIWLVREILARRPRAYVLGGAGLLTMPQIEFFFVTTLMLTAAALARHVWKPLAFAMFLWLPALVGIVADRSVLGGIPFSLGWERGQSIAPFDALQLNGYFTHYGDAFRGWFSIPMFVTAALAIPALTLRNRKLLTVAAGTFAALIFAMGTKSIFGPMFSWAVVHFRPIALYRELYDVLGYVAIGYVVLASATCARWRFAGWIWLAAVLLLPVAWIVSPPSRFWVPSNELPTVTVPRGVNTRFALVPAFQPMWFNGRGSGTDPDAYSRADNVTPLNEYLASYPVDAALSAFLLHGQMRPLEALSVATVIERSRLQTDMNSIKEQWALPFRHFPKVTRLRVIRLRGFPELAILPISQAQIDPVNGPVAVTAPNVEVHAWRGWVDARFAFAERPDLAQPFGGALTTDPQAQLAVRGGVDALVYVEGTLRGSDGRMIVRATHGYRWVAIPTDVRSVMCSGLCVVAAQGTPVPMPSFAAAYRGRGVDFRQILPWLAVADAPPGSAGVLRYNVTYDPNWAAYLGGKRLPHVKLEGIVNGWLLPARDAAQHLVLIHVVSLIQFILEIFAIAVVAGVGIVWLIRYLRARRAATPG